MHREYQWNAFDGLVLYGQSWSPAEPKALICLVHGFNDHSARFDHWSRRLVAEGFAVAAVDLRGHGRSEGRRGYARNYFDLIEDVQVLMAKARHLFPGIPLILYGHSMGGNLVTNYLLAIKDMPVAAVVTSPWFTLTKQPPLITMIGARFLKTFLPFMVVKSNIDAAGLSRDPAVVEAYINDPLVHNLIQPNLFFAVEENGLRASRHIYKINIPMLVMHGSKDNITSVIQTRSFVQNAGKLTTYKEWPGCSHELHNDLQADEVFSYLTEWLNRQVKR
jgi:alpha-beta hydrolase superfamily lysophospholipase